jgi:hypothetical protein
MGRVYAVFMSLGWLLVRVSADGRAPAGRDPAAAKNKPLVTTAQVSATSALRTPQSSASDVLGRRNMYRIYLGVGALMYLVVVLTTNANKVVFLVACIRVQRADPARPRRFLKPEGRDAPAEQAGARA